MKTPLNPYEQISYDLNFFHEKRIVERRQKKRMTPDRRKDSMEKKDIVEKSEYPVGMH